MTFTIPMWLIWTLGIVAGIALLFGIAIVVVFAWCGMAFSRSIGRGLGW